MGVEGHISAELGLFPQARSNHSLQFGPHCPAFVIHVRAMQFNGMIIREAKNEYASL